MLLVWHYVQGFLHYFFGTTFNGFSSTTKTQTSTTIINDRYILNNNLCQCEMNNQR